MPEFPYLQGGVARTVGVTGGADSRGVVLTANASANTKGTAVELVASTEFDANWAFITLTDASGGTSFLVDVMIGAATEQVIIPDLYMRSRAAGGGGPSFLFPIFIPRASRLTARCQASTGGSTIRISVTLVSGTLLSSGAPPAWVSAYGDVTTSQGTNVDPGATANTDSAWVQITAATDRTHHWLCASGRFGDQSIAASMLWRLDIGIGAATEQDLVPDIHITADVTTDNPYNGGFCLPCFIPAGSRLTARARCSNNTDVDRDIYLKLYGAGD